MSYGNNQDSGWRPSQGVSKGVPRLLAKPKKPNTKPTNQNLQGGYAGRDSGWIPGSSSRARSNKEKDKNKNKNKGRTYDPNSRVGQQYGTSGHGGSALPPTGGRAGDRGRDRVSGGGTWGPPKDKSKTNKGTGILLKPQAKERSGLTTAPVKKGKLSAEYWAKRDTNKKNREELKNIKGAAARRAFRIKHGYHRGMYYGPDIFKGDLKKIDAWEKAGRPNLKGLMGAGQVMRNKPSSRTTDMDLAYNRKKDTRMFPHR